MCLPVPDPQIAAGPGGSIMQMVNVDGTIGIHPNCNPQCTTGLYFPLSQFFGFPQESTHLLSDPRVLYDRQSERRFASILDVSITSVRLAVSESSDPFCQ